MKPIFHLSSFISQPQRGFIKLTKRTLFLLSSVVLAFAVIVIINQLISPETTQAAWFNDNWAYRQSIPVGTHSAAESNVYIEFTVDTASLTTDKLQADCDDLRFTKNDGKILPYQIVSGCDSATTTIRVGFDTMPAASFYFYMYYGNPSTSSGSTTLSQSACSNTCTAGTFATEEKAPSPVAYWKFDDATGTTAKDSTTNALNGTLSVENASAGDGADGAVTFSSDTNINTANTISGRSCADGGDAVNYSVTASVAAGATSVTLSSTPATGCLAAGDEVMIINLQGTSGNLSNVGLFDTATIASIATATLTLTTPLTNAYDGTTQKIMVQRIPNYTTVTIDSTKTLSATAWDGTKGGVLAFRATGTVTVTGSISVASSGYSSGAHSGFCNASNGNGYGIGGISTTGFGGVASGRCTDNGLPGGGGGGYGSAGTAGIAGSSGSAGTAGATYGVADLSRLYFGGGGGDGINWNGSSNGGAGGGIVFIGADTVTVAGTISANGGSGADGGGTSHSGRGGGAGGSVKISAETLTLGSSLVTASGGTAGGTAGSNSNGGDGGSGRIATIATSSSGTTSPAATTSTSITYTSPTWQTQDQCISGTCLYFSGSNQNISKSDSNTLDFAAADNFTVQSWVKRNGAASANTVILSKSSANISTTYTGYKLYMDASGDLCFDIQDGTNAVDSACTSAVDFDDNQWHFVSGVKAGTSSITLYVDGVSRATDSSIASTGTLANASTLYIGADSNGVSNGWAGFIDEPKIYRDNSTRTADQVKADFSSRSNPEGAASVAGTGPNNLPGALNNGMVGYWKMDESSGNAADSSGNSLTLTNNATTTYVTGKFGNGSEYVPASSQYLSTATTISGIKTVSFWVNPDSTTNYYASLTSSAYITSSSGTLSATGFTSPTIYVNGAQTTTIAADVWSLVTVTSDTAINADTFYVGRQGSNYFDGTIDEVRTYNRALSPAEVSQLYNFAPGPVGYWKMDEASGDLTDSSGNGYTGTVTGTTSSVGKYGKGRTFNGSSDYVDVGTGLNQTGSFTVSSWFRTTATSAVTIIDRNGSTNTNYRLFVNDRSGVGTANKLTGRVYFATSGAVNLTGSTSVNDGAWHHTNLVYDAIANKLYLYLDGRLEVGATNGGTGSLSDTSDKTYIGVIGSDAAVSDSYWNGQLDEVKVYNYARTPDQITSDMNAGHPSVGSPVGSALGHWKFDEGAANTCSGGSNDVCNSGSQGSTSDGAFAGTSPTITQSGKYGKALTFDGSATKVTLPETGFDAANLTVSTWVNLAATQSTRTFVSKYADTTGWALGISDSNSNKVKWFTSNGSGNNDTLESTTTLSNSTWYHVLATFDGTTKKLYINGNLESSVTWAQTIGYTSSVSSIGYLRGSGSGVQFFNGTLDDVKIYNYALTADQAKLDMNNGKAQVLSALSDNSSYQKQAANQEYCIPGDSTSCAAPVARWDFSENTGSTVNDTSGNSNTGTWNGTLGSQWKVGKVGPGGNFNGSDNYVSAGDDSSINFGTGNFTISGWAKYSGSGGFTILSKGDDLNSGQAANKGWYGLESAGGSNIDFIISQHAFNWIDWRCSLATAKDGSWHQLVGTYDNSSRTAKLYMDGKEQSCSLQSESKGSGSINTDSNAALNIGVDNLYGGYHSGIIDQVRLYNYVRTPAQIAWDYNKGAPVGHWRLDECQGTSVNDSSGNSNTGTITVGASGTYTSVGTCPTSSASSMWYNGATGKFNSSLAFDGTDDYITVSDSSSLDLSSAVTLSAWVKLTSVPGVCCYTIFAKDGTWSTTGTNYQLDVRANGNIEFAYRGSDNSANEFITSDTPLSSANTWYHVVLTFDTTNNPRIYVNGVLRTGSYASGSITTMGTNSNPLYIGKQISNYFFSGQIDDARVYNYGLTATQVKQLYNENFSVRYGPLTGSP